MLASHAWVPGSSIKGGIPMPEQQILYLSRADVEEVKMPMGEIIDLLERAFAEKGHGRVEMPPKPGIHTMHDAFIHAMPAFISSMRSAGIKWVSGYPENSKRGLPYISGLLILNDVETGIPYAVMDCTWITAARTGAASALSAKYLARPDSKSAGILACGVQGRTNLRAVACLFPLEKVFAYDVVPEVEEAFIAEMRKEFDLEFHGVDDPEKAVVSSDVVVTSGPILKHPNPTIQEDWLQSGSFASAVDFDSYWSGPAMAQVDLLSTDDHAQFQYYKSVGYFGQTPDPYADLGEIVAGIKPGRQSQGERTMAINLGLAIDDMAVAPEIYARASMMGLGTNLPL
jgi:ornithine cyclodeaminase/alanine dehydrogenase-like protein (mu-crystallin family)